jgi:DNA-binding transcriptional LysR family regulator
MHSKRVASLPSTLGAFRKACPGTALNLFDMTPAEQYRALEERKIDLGFVCLRARPTGSDLQWSCVSHDAIIAAVAAGSPLAQKAKIDLKDLEPMFFVGMSEKTYPGFCRGGTGSRAVVTSARRVFRLQA